MNTSPLYQRVLQALQAKQFTQRQISAGSGVPFSTVSKIAQGATTNPTIRNLQALADFFDRVETAAPCSPACPLAHARHHTQQPT